VLNDTLWKIEGLLSYGWELLSFDSLSDWSLEILAVQKSASLDKTLGKCQKTMDNLGERIKVLAQMASDWKEPTPALVTATAKTKNKKAAVEVKDMDETMLYDLAVSDS
jgi:hypothetical protein